MLAHACLLVDIDTRRLTDIVNRFYEIAGSDARFSDKDVTSVRHCLGDTIELGNRTGAVSLTDHVRALVLSSIRNADADY